MEGIVQTMDPSPTKLRELPDSRAAASQGAEAAVKSTEDHTSEQPAAIKPPTHALQELSTDSNGEEYPTMNSLLPNVSTMVSQEFIGSSGIEKHHASPGSVAADADALATTSGAEFGIASQEHKIDKTDKEILARCAVTEHFTIPKAGDPVPKEPTTHPFAQQSISKELLATITKTPERTLPDSTMPSAIYEPSVSSLAMGSPLQAVDPVGSAVLTGPVTQAKSSTCDVVHNIPFVKVNGNRRMSVEIPPPPSSSYLKDFKTHSGVGYENEMSDVHETLADSGSSASRGNEGGDLEPNVGPKRQGRHLGVAGLGQAAGAKHGPIKRGRGRPPKERGLGQAASAKHSPSKKGRGRPPKARGPGQEAGRKSRATRSQRGAQRD